MPQFFPDRKFYIYHTPNQSHSASLFSHHEQWRGVCLIGMHRIIGICLRKKVMLSKLIFLPSFTYSPWQTPYQKWQMFCEWVTSRRSKAAIAGAIRPWRKWTQSACHRINHIRIWPYLFCPEGMTCSCWGGIAGRILDGLIHQVTTSF